MEVTKLGLQKSCRVCPKMVEWIGPHGFFLLVVVVASLALAQITQVVIRKS